MCVFREEQRFSQIWLVILMTISALVPILIALISWHQNKFDEPWAPLFIIALTLVCCGFIFIVKLKTLVNEKGISYRFAPFQVKSKFIHWSDIKSASLRKYSPLAEYGGWGWKMSFNKKKGGAINVKGNMGLQLELHSGKKILLGTQKPKSLAKFIAKYKPNLYINEL